MLVMLSLSVSKSSFGYHLTGHPSRRSFRGSDTYRAQTIDDCMAVARALLELSEAMEADDEEAEQLARDRLDSYR